MAISRDEFDKIVKKVLPRYTSAVLEARPPVISELVDEHLNDVNKTEREAIYQRIRTLALQERWEDLRLKNRQQFRSRLDRQDATDDSIDIVKTVNTLIRDQYHVMGDLQGALIESLKKEFERQIVTYDDYDTEGNGIGQPTVTSAMSVDNQMRFLKIVFDELNRVGKLGFAMLKYLGLGHDDDEETKADKALMSTKSDAILTNTAELSTRIAQGPKLVPKAIKPDEADKIFSKLDNGN